MEEYLTVQEFAFKCGVHIGTIYNRIRSGEIEALKKGSATFIHKDTPAKGRKMPGRKTAREQLTKE